MLEWSSRRELFRWMGWFALTNAVLLTVVDLRYLIGFTPGGTILSWLYLLLVFPAHHVLVATVPMFVCLTPLVLLLPSRAWVNRLAVIIYALLIAVLMLDSLLWSQSRFHVNALTLQILGWQSWAFVGVIFSIGLFFEMMLAQWVWRWVDGRRKRGGAVIGVLSSLAIIGSNLIFAWADANYYVPVTSAGPQLPVYEGFTAKRLLTRLGMVDQKASRQRAVALRLAGPLDDDADKVLNYPLKPLQCQQESPLNLLLILSDAMRSDMLQETITPFLWNMAQHEAAWFTHHYSGGNSSRMGVFSLFYGLPPGYWSSFEALQRSSVLLDEMQRQGYQLGLFTSSTMYRPVTLDRTAFANVPNLRVSTEPLDAPAWKRDQLITREWKEWLRQHDQQRPFFGFLFYDSTNAQVYPEATDTKDDLPAEGLKELDIRFSNYRKSIRFVDGLIKSVLTDLENQGLADRTVVIITSDHGEEFDDSGLGLKDHGSAYTRYQLQVPMLVRWPGRPAQRFEHRTSHYDVVPTLMKDLLGCSNPAEDYASGRNLFDGVDWSWLLVGSYYNYAVAEPDQLTVTFPSGRFEVRDRDYQISSQPQIRGDVLEAASRENSRFYKQ
ncbi:MAG TPA: DUF3413 domain-containing protein [Xanthomonadales bacterium]|nr:DUF3413 domain-containing protein [Xanthomonadales bacterium]